MSFILNAAVRLLGSCCQHMHTNIEAQVLVYPWTDWFGPRADGVSGVKEHCLVWLAC